MGKIPKGDRQQERDQMVRLHIAARGIDDENVLEAMRQIPRELFIPPDLRRHAYTDSALPIDEHQTISQPYIVALMTAALELSHEDRVLEIGTGSAYAAAVLGYIAREVYTIERHRSLADQARTILQRTGFTNIEVIHGDGSNGWPPEAPYDAIVVTAGAPAVPQPLVDQLKIEGKLVLPLGSQKTNQELIQICKREDGSLEQTSLGAVRFVPLIGEHAWDNDIGAD